MIELTMKLYLDNKKLLAGSKEDMEIAVSNILNTNITDTGIIALGKSLTGSKRYSFFEMVSQHEFDNGSEEIKATVNLRASKLRQDCKPWDELFKNVKKKATKIERKIIEYEVANLFLNTITEGDTGFIKKVNLELEW
jgi:hypothetical protein